MQQYLQLLGRDCHVVNLDPANEVPPPSSLTTSIDGDDDGHALEDNVTVEVTAPDDPNSDDDNGNSQLPYEAILDVCQDIISLDSVMLELNLGPNGG